MFHFTRYGKQVRVVVDLKISDLPTYEYTLFWNCNDDVYAELLADKLRDALQRKLERIRRTSYEEGFADAKAKRRKRTFFNFGWFINEDK